MGREVEPLLGRGIELDLLRGELAEVVAGEARFVVVSGEAGIGKTRLLEELSRIAEEQGFLTLQGRCSELDTERPFGPYADALDAYLGSLDPQAVGRMEADRLGALASVFPSLHGLDLATDYPATVTERFRAHHAVRDVLERLAARRPVLVVLDDMHWADGASLELTSYLFRNPPQGEVLLAFALRPKQGGAAMSATMGLSYGMEHVRNLHLTALDEEAAKELVMGAENVDVDEVLRLSGGNPFYAKQLARSGLGHASVGDRSLEVPGPVATAIAVELSALSPDERAVADAAAVAGDPFDIDLAVAASGRLEDDVLAGIDVLLSRDLVRETDVPRRFQFRHPIVHRAVYVSCAPSVKVSCHRRVVDALGRRGASPIVLATHVEQSARHGDLAAVDILRRAADSAAATAPTSAIRWLTAGLRLLPADGPVAEKVGMLTRLAASQGALGRFADAYETLEKCISLTGPSGSGYVEAIVACAQMEQLLGHHSDSRDRLEKAYRELENPASKEGVSLLIALTSASLYLSEPDQTLKWGQLAIDAAGSLEDRGLVAAALAASTMGAAFAGRVGLGLELHDRCAGLVDSLPDEVLVAHLDALANLVAAEIYLDRHVLGCDHGERALRLARASKQTHLLPILTPILGTSLALTGRMERSAEVLDDAIEAARLVGDAQGLSMNLFNRALSASMAGDLDTSFRTGAESVELARSVDNGVITAFAGAIHAQTLLEVGDAAEARSLLLNSVGGPEVPLLAGGWRAHFFEVLTRCNLALGDFDAARQAAEHVRDLIVEDGSVLARLMADRAGAEVALAGGSAETAVEYGRSAVSCAEEIGALAHVAPSRALLARALVASGQEDEGVAQLEMAAEEFDVLGAQVYRNRVEAELRRLGRATTHRRSSPGSADTGVDSLTGRELEVAELVVDRRTNREIAEELFLSTKTVETHLRNIFNKLGVTSRVEVARALVKAGQTG